MKDKSLEEINVLKLLIYALSFISICTALILFLLLPTLKNYQQANLRENSQFTVLKAAQTKFDFSMGKISDLKNKDNKSLDQFKQDFNIKNFGIFLQQYFKNIQIKELGPEKQEKYLKNRLFIQATIDNPKRLYDFIDALKNYKNLIKVDYPLKLKAAEQGIVINLTLTIYSS